MNTIETVQALQPETQSLAYSGRSIDYMDGYEAGFESAKDSILAQMQAAQSPAPAAPAPTSQWQDIATAPKDGTPFLAWFPKMRLDDDDEMTDEVIGGAHALVSCNGGAWNEPDWLDAHGSYYMEDWCFAESPTLWQPLPSAPLSASPEDKPK